MTYPGERRFWLLTLEKERKKEKKLKLGIKHLRIASIVDHNDRSYA